MKRNLGSSSFSVLFLALVLIGSITVTADEWPMFHHDPQHTGFSTSAAPETNNSMWTDTVGSIIRSSPAFGKGRMYIGSTDGDLYCFDAEPEEGTDEGVADPPGSTYDLVWTFATGGSIYSSPAFYDGKVYFGSSDGKIYCVYACIGTEVWNYTSGSTMSSSPTVIDDKVYIGSQDGKVYCLDAETGSHIWENQTGGSVVSSPAVANARVYVGANDNKVYCLYASNGTQQWNFTTDGLVMSSPTIHDNNLYVGSTDGKLYCLDATNGTHLWNYTTGSGIRYSTPAVAYDKVYVGSWDNKVYCLNTTNNGAHLWNFTTGGVVVSSPAVADAKVYVGSNDGKVYCLDASDGTELWRYDLGDIVSSSPAVTNKRVYVGSKNGKIMCFRDHNPPRVPGAPDGPETGIVGEHYRFYSDTSDPEQDEILYKFDWGDNTTSDWLGPFTQYESVNTTHAWDDEGDYEIRVKAKDSFGYESNWSDPLTIHIGILDISRVRGGLGVHAEIANLGSRKLWRLDWSITVFGGLIHNPATDKTAEGSIISLGAGEIETVRTGPFFEFGRIQIKVEVSDDGGETIITKTTYGFALGYLVFMSLF